MNDIITKPSDEQMAALPDPALKGWIDFGTDQQKSWAAQEIRRRKGKPIKEEQSVPTNMDLIKSHLAEINKILEGPHGDELRACLADWAVDLIGMSPRKILNRGQLRGLTRTLGYLESKLRRIEMREMEKARQMQDSKDAARLTYIGVSTKPPQTKESKGNNARKVRKALVRARRAAEPHPVGRQGQKPSAGRRQ